MTQHEFESQVRDRQIQDRLRKIEGQLKALGSEVLRAFRGLLDSLEAAGGREERCVAALEALRRLLEERLGRDADDWWKGNRGEETDAQ